MHKVRLLCHKEHDVDMFTIILTVIMAPFMLVFHAFKCIFQIMFGITSKPFKKKPKRRRNRRMGDEFFFWWW